jgi:hypothetical protein
MGLFAATLWAVVTVRGASRPIRTGCGTTVTFAVSPLHAVPPPRRRFPDLCGEVDYNVDNAPCAHISVRRGTPETPTSTHGQTDGDTNATDAPTPTTTNATDPPTTTAAQTTTGAPTTTICSALGVSGNGVDYRGSLGVTELGFTCQDWSAQSPHPNPHTLTAFPGFGLEDGPFCRNPDSEVRPWCYTTDPDKLWDYCDICSESSACCAVASPPLFP